MDLNYHSEKFENSSLAEGSTTMPPASATSSSSNGYTILVAPDDDDGEQYEVLDNVHSDFLQHFENEIRISPLCVEEHTEILNDLKASLAGDASRSSKKWKNLQPAADGVVSENSNARRDNSETSQTLLHSHNGMPPVTDQQYVARVSDFLHVQSHGSALGSILATGSNNQGSNAQSHLQPSTASVVANTLLGDLNTAKKPVTLSPSAITFAASAAAAAAAAPRTPAGVGSKSSAAVRRGGKDAREPSLSVTFPAKVGPYELKIIRQPEDQHRARYLTEGSRGTVKDKSQQSHPTVQLTGYDQVVVLQVFIGTETGRMKPHGFYQACKVSSKNSTPCIERDIEGTTVIEILLEPKNDMVAVIDCIGILKLRNADVEQRIGLAKSKKKSTSARLIFRVNIPKVDGTLQTLQIASTPVICTQPIGAPEISKKSISQSSPAGGEEMFIIGKNFMKGTVVVFEEVRNDRVVWSAEAEIDQDYFQATHLVCRVPPYNCTDVSAMQQKEVQIVVHSNGRTSEPVSFFYVPVSRLSEQKCVQHNSSVSSPSSLDKLNSPVCSDKTIISALEQTVETKGDLTLRLSDGSSLKRPYDPSSQEDLSRIAKSVAINHAAAADDKAAIRHQAVNLAQPDLTEQTVGGVDQTVDGSSLSAVRSQSVGRGGELDSDVVRHLGSHGDLFQQHIDASAMRLEADMSVVSIKSDIAAADVSRPVILSSFQSPAQASTNDMTLFESTSVAQPVEIASNLPIQPTGSVLDFVQTNHSSIVLDSVEGRHHLGEPHPKRQASFPTAELPVQMLMLMNNGADKVDDMKMQWGSVGGNISASNVAAGTDPTQQTHGQATNDVFRFASLSTLDGSAANGGVLFNFGNNHGIVFASQFPSDAAAALGGFGDGAALDMATCGNDSIVLSSGPQRMDTNVSHYAVDSSGDAFVRGGANSGVGGGYVDGIDGGQRFSPSQSSNDLQNVHNTIASMLTACQSAGLVQHSMEAMPHTTGGGMLAGSGPSDGGLAAPSIVRMDVSNSPIPAAGLATISGDISDNMVPCAADMVVKPHSEGGDTSPYGDSSTHCFTAADAANHNYVATSVVGMDISSAVQIAGMNMPEISPQPLSIVTMPLGDSGNLQQSLAELLNLQQQVAGTTPSGSSKTNSAPQSPPYRRSSMSRHDMSGHTDLAAAVATEDIAVQNSGVGFIDSRLSPPGGHPAPFPAGHGFIQSTNDLSSSATGMMQSAPGNTTCYDSSYRHEHTTAAEMYSAQVSTPAAASWMCSDEVGANVQNAATLSQWVSQQQQQDDGSFLLGNADLFGGGGQVNLKREEQYADNVLGLLVDKSGAWNQLSQVHGIDAAGPDGTVGQHHVTSADLSAVASSEIAGLSDIQNSTIVSPVGGMLYSTEQPYVILVSSTPQGHPGSHHGLRTSTETSTPSNGDHSVGVVQLSQPVLNTLTESSAMGGGSPSVPFLLVASLQSNDVNSAALDTVPASSNMASNPASCHGDVMRLDHAMQGVLPYGDALKSSDTTRNARIVEHSAIAAESKSDAAPSASVSGEQRSPEVPLLLYKLLTEDTVPTATQPTPLLTASLDSSSLPDLSFDDINQVLNSSSLSHSG